MDAICDLSETSSGLGSPQTVNDFKRLKIWMNELNVACSKLRYGASMLLFRHNAPTADFAVGTARLQTTPEPAGTVRHS